MLIVQALLEVVSHPEFDISSMTYNFWHSLQDNLTRRYYDLMASLMLIEFYSLKRSMLFHGLCIPGILICHTDLMPQSK